jgi:hypothetical protein
MMTRRSTVDWVLQRTAAAEPRVTLRYGTKVDATGRRSPVDDWLARIGGRATATWQAECGIAYFSRHYRVRPGASLPGLLAR